MARDSCGNENERLQRHDDDDDEEKDGFDAFVIVLTYVFAYSAVAFEALVTGGTPVASVHASTGRRQLSALDDLENYFC